MVGRVIFIASADCHTFDVVYQLCIAHVGGAFEESWDNFSLVHAGSGLLCEDVYAIFKHYNFLDFILLKQNTCKYRIIHAYV